MWYGLSPRCCFQKPVFQNLSSRVQQEGNITHGARSVSCAYDSTYRTSCTAI
jgi:hypothetical protein